MPDDHLVPTSQEIGFRGRPPAYLRWCFDRLDPTEIKIVHRFASIRSRPVGLRLALIVNRLGDGWLYPPVAFGVILGVGRNAVNPLLFALVSVCLAHLIYPPIKAYIARPRPFEKDATLKTACPPIDRYSCPSGHLMTATAAFLPIGAAHPLWLCILSAIWILVGMVRNVLGHHYPSDLLVGAGLGGAAVLTCDVVSTSLRNLL